LGNSCVVDISLPKLQRLSLHRIAELDKLEWWNELSMCNDFAIEKGDFTLRAQSGLTRSDLFRESVRVVVSLDYCSFFLATIPHRRVRVSQHVRSSVLVLSQSNYR